MHNGLHLLSLYQPPIRGIFSLLSLYQPPIRGIFFTEMEGLQNSTYGASHMQGAVTIQTFIRKQQALSRWPESQKILKLLKAETERLRPSLHAVTLVDKRSAYGVPSLIDGTTGKLRLLEHPGHAAWGGLEYALVRAPTIEFGATYANSVEHTGEAHRLDLLLLPGDHLGDDVLYTPPLFFAVFNDEIKDG